MPTLRRLLVIEAVAFAAASTIHSGLLIDVSVDPGASTAEGVIALVLFAGALVAGLRPAWTWVAAAAAQLFGLLGSLIGLFLVTRGVAPGTIPDVIFHIAVVLTLATGLAAAIRARPDQRARAAA